MSKNRIEKILNNTNVVLYTLIIAILLVLIIGSSYVLVKKIKEKSNEQKNTPQYSVNTILQNIKIYNDFGRIRCKTNDNPSIPIVISPSFSYSSDNIPLYEEIIQKNKKIKNIIIYYFSSKTIKQLKTIGETNINSEIKKLINKELVMGSIEEIFFEDYIFLE